MSEETSPPRSAANVMQSPPEKAIVTAEFKAEHPTITINGRELLIANAVASEDGALIAGKLTTGQGFICCPNCGTVDMESGAKLNLSETAEAVGDKPARGLDGGQIYFPDAESPPEPPRPCPTCREPVEFGAREFTEGHPDCPTCGGSGMVEDKPDNSDWPPFDAKPCDDCGGSGDAPSAIVD